MSNFTLQDALKVQSEHVVEWGTKLNEKCFLALVQFVESENAKLTEESSPYSVCRGNDLYTFIANWKG